MGLKELLVDGETKPKVVYDAQIESCTVSVHQVAKKSMKVFLRNSVMVVVLVVSCS